MADNAGLIAHLKIRGERHPITGFLTPSGESVVTRYSDGDPLCKEAAAALAEAERKIEKLTEERDRAKREVEICHARETCICGDYMKGHSSYSRHTGVSMYDYALDIAEQSIRALTARCERMEAVVKAARKIVGEGHGFPWLTGTMADAKAMLDALAALDQSPAPEREGPANPPGRASHGYER